MIPPEHAALADAIMKEVAGINFDEAVKVATYMLRHLREAGYEIRARGEA